MVGGMGPAVSGRHRQAKRLAAYRAALADRAVTLGENLAIAGALCAAYREGRNQEWRRLTVSPGWIWQPGCGLEVRR